MQLGADPEQLDELADRLGREADQIAKSTAAINRALTRVYWRGPHANEFRRRWSTVHKPMAENASEALRAMARATRDNARQQRAASDGGPGVGVAVGAHGGAGSGAGGGGHSGGGGGGGGGGGWGKGDEGPHGIPKGRGDEGGTKVDGEYKITDDTGKHTIADGSKAKGWEKGEDGKWRPKEEGPAKPDEKVKTDAKVSAELASDHREGTIGVDKKVSGEYHGAVDAKGDARVIAGIHGENDASLKVENGNVVASTEGSVMAGVKGEMSGEIGKGPVKVGGGASAFGGAEASYGLEGSIGRDGVKVGGEIGGFAGVRADADMFGSISGVKAGAGVGVEAGIGAGASGGAAFNLHEVGVHGDLHVALGVGVHVKVDLSVDPGKVASDGWHAAGKVVHGVGHLGSKIPKLW